MRHVSLIFALVIGFAVGFVGRGAVDGGGHPAARPGAQAQPQRPRPVEDPRAVYRVPVDGSAVKGPADALVTIVESSDFECPFCKRGAATMKQLEAEYGGKVRFVFKHNPLAFHANALPAALAAEEARAQGGDEKFWALHERIFELAPKLDVESIARAAGELGLDAAKIREAIETRRHLDRIQQDQRLVTSLGAGATPTFFVNGRKLAGAQPIEAFRAIVDEELAKAEKLVRGGTPADQVYARIIEAGATAPVHQPGTAPAPQAARPGAPGAAPAPAAPRPPPPAVYQKVPVRADDPARGPKEAPLTVVLFSDFECPFCARVEPTVKKLEEAFPGKLRIVWKHQPLAFHARAMPAALAAEAAREQGKFWQMHERIFASPRELSDADLEQHARAIGLDLGRYQAAMAGRRHADRIAQDQELARGVGANGTPTLFFNCRQLVGAQPLESMRAVAAEELQKAETLLAGAKPGPGFYDRACDANVARAPAAAAAAPSPSVQPAVLAAKPAGAIPVRADDPAKGSPRAPITIVLFSDFECPFCSKVNPTLAEVERTYGDKVRVVWKHQPLPFHRQAVPAALAAEAAREQGKFWPMHDLIFANQRTLSDDAYERFAREIGLDLAKYRKAVASSAAKARIAEDQALAARIDAQATPTMFVNGVKVEGAVPFAQLRAVIDGQLAARQ